VQGLRVLQAQDAHPSAQARRQRPHADQRHERCAQTFGTEGEQSVMWLHSGITCALAPDLSMASPTCQRKPKVGRLWISPIVNRPVYLVLGH